MRWRLREESQKRKQGGGSLGKPKIKIPGPRRSHKTNGEVGGKLTLSANLTLCFFDNGLERGKVPWEGEGNTF